MKPGNALAASCRKKTPGRQIKEDSGASLVEVLKGEALG
jgi:hypothetical protein